MSAAALARWSRSRSPSSPSSSPGRSSRSSAAASRPTAALDLDPLGDVLTRSRPPPRRLVHGLAGRALDRADARDRASRARSCSADTGSPAAASCARWSPSRSCSRRSSSAPRSAPSASPGRVGAILLAHVFFNYAVVVRTVGGLWSHLDPRPEEAAQMLGASRWRTFVDVTLPALRPAIIAAASIVFLFCFTSFGVILVLGGPRYATLETEIYRQTAQLLDLPVAAALAIVQLAAVLAALERRQLGPRPAHRRARAPRRERGERPPARCAAPARSSPRTSSSWRCCSATPIVVLVRRSFDVRARRVPRAHRDEQRLPRATDRRGVDIAALRVDRHRRRAGRRRRGRVRARGRAPAAAPAPVGCSTCS